MGVLTFDVVSTPFTDERLVELPPAFDGPIEVAELSIAESGSCAESGVLLKGEDDSRIVIVVGASPYCLAVKGVVDWPHVFEPEYPEESYVVTPLA